jgi:isopenicillin-N epimerase
MLRDLWTFTGSTPEGPTLMRQAAAEVAAFVGAAPENLVFVDNTTTGVNAVAQSMPLRSGDEILITDQAYGGIVAALHYVSARAGVTVVTVEVPYPALPFPVRDIVRACHDRGVPVLVDGAHVPGSVSLDVAAIGADIYVANLHKWAMAPRSCGFMAVSPEFQAMVHPPVISWGLGSGFTQEFDWVGTRDPTPWLTAPEGIRFLHELGYDALRRHNHDLAWRAARMLTGRWETPLDIDESVVGCMVTVQAPARCGTTQPDAARLRDRLLFEHNVEVQVHARVGRVWIRVSAQAYNDEADIERLADAV